LHQVLFESVKRLKTWNLIKIRLKFRYLLRLEITLMTTH